MANTPIEEPEFNFIADEMRMNVSRAKPPHNIITLLTYGGEEGRLIDTEAKKSFYTGGPEYKGKLNVILPRDTDF